MKIRGTVFSGVLRGKPLIRLYFYRLVGLLGFEPYKGTMDVKLERKMDIKLYSTKSIDHILLDGTKAVNAYLAPAKVIIQDYEKTEYECWAMQQADGIYEDDIVELIAKESLKEKFALHDGDTIEIEFSETGKKERKKILDIFRKKNSQLMKRG